MQCRRGTNETRRLRLVSQRLEVFVQISLRHSDAKSPASPVAAGRGEPNAQSLEVSIIAFRLIGLRGRWRRSRGECGGRQYQNRDYSPNEATDAVQASAHRCCTRFHDPLLKKLQCSPRRRCRGGNGRPNKYIPMSFGCLHRRRGIPVTLPKTAFSSYQISMAGYVRLEVRPSSHAAMRCFIERARAGLLPPVDTVISVPSCRIWATLAKSEYVGSDASLTRRQSVASDRRRRASSHTCRFVRRLSVQAMTIAASSGRSQDA